VQPFVAATGREVGGEQAVIQVGPQAKVTVLVAHRGVRAQVGQRPGATAVAPGVARAGAQGHAPGQPAGTDPGAPFAQPRVGARAQRIIGRVVERLVVIKEGEVVVGAARVGDDVQAREGVAADPARACTQGTSAERTDGGFQVRVRRHATGQQVDGADAAAAAQRRRDHAAVHLDGGQSFGRHLVERGGAIPGVGQGHAVEEQAHLRRRAAAQRGHGRRAVDAQTAHLQAGRGRQQRRDVAAGRLVLQFDARDDARGCGQR
jgi:hypothetical protein